MSQSARVGISLGAEGEAVVKRFEVARRQGIDARVADILPPDGSTRPHALVELIHVDLEYRLRAGEFARVEDYLTAYPELGELPTALCDLLVAEKALRDRW